MGIIAVKADKLLDAMRAELAQAEDHRRASALTQTTGSLPRLQAQLDAAQGAERVIAYHLMAGGDGWIAVDDQPPVRFTTAEVVLMSHGDDRPTIAGPPPTDR